ncbi:hypothetical protein, partial [Fischerella thermalis]|uniref:hypothetical protein n=1 Tax=Fischerella thermalis TaxID=372787 RepID=UPI00241F67EF
FFDRSDATQNDGKARFKPITPILQLIKYTISNLSLCPLRWSSLLLLRQQWFNDFPLFVG